MKRWFILLPLLLTSCFATTEPPPAPTRTVPASPPLTATAPVLPPTRTPTASFTPTVSPSATPTSKPTDVPTPAPLPDATFPLRIPVPQDARTTTVDTSYRFGTTQNSVREVHTGVEFLNAFGSPVLAAGPGTVYFAGDDNNGGPYGPANWFAYYGNYVILEHTQANGDPVYTFYAHLSEILVEEGQIVDGGEEIGKIGFTGAAVGPHLHFEVRTLTPDFAALRNPEIWLEPRKNTGALAGLVLNARETPANLDSIVLTHEKTGEKYFLRTYEAPAMMNQPPFHESFGINNLPIGRYEIAFVLGGLQKNTIKIDAGGLTRWEWRREQ